MRRRNRRVSATVRRAGSDYRLQTTNRTDGLPTHTDTIFVVVLQTGVLGAFNWKGQIA